MAQTSGHQPSPIRPTIPPMFSALPIFFQRKPRSQVKAGVYLVGHKTQLKGAPLGQGRWPLAPTILQRQAAAIGTVCFFTIRVGITSHEACGSPQSLTQFYPPDFPGIQRRTIRFHAFSAQFQFCLKSSASPYKALAACHLNTLSKTPVSGDHTGWWMSKKH